MWKTVVLTPIVKVWLYGKLGIVPRLELEKTPKLVVGKTICYLSIWSST